MSINSSGQNINVNGNLILGSSKKVRSSKFEFSTDGTSLDYSSGAISTTSNLSAAYLSGNGKNITHTTDASAGTYGNTTAIPTITVDSDGRISTISTASIPSGTLQGVTDAGSNTTNTIKLENATSLITEGQVSVANTAPTNGVDFSVGTSLVVKDGASETMTTQGGIQATHFIGDASNLTNVSDLSSAAYGTATKVPRITFDANGRISTITETDMQSVVSAATTNQIAVYTDTNTVGGSAAATFNPNNGNMEITGSFTAGGSLIVTGDLRVDGNTTVTQNVLVEDPIMEIGNVASATTTLGTVLSRADGNVATGVYLSSDHASANTLVFGHTTSSGASSTIVIDGSKQLDAKFYGNVETTNYFVGDGSKLTNIDFSAVDNNAETRLATLEADHASNVTRIASLETDLSTAEGDISTLQTNLSTVNSNVNSVKANLESNITRIDNNFTVLDSSITTVNSNVESLKTKTDGLTFSNGTYTFTGNVVATSNINSTNLNGNLFASSITLGEDATINVSSLSLQDICEVGNTYNSTMTVDRLQATTLSVSSTKNFDIPHPINEGKRLVHACIETARADNLYTGEAILKDGRAEVDLDMANSMSPGTFVALNKNIRVFTTNESDWDAVKGSVNGSTLTISSQNSDSQAKVSWLVVGTRKDIPDLIVEP